MQFSVLKAVLLPRPSLPTFQGWQRSLCLLSCKWPTELISWWDLLRIFTTTFCNCRKLPWFCPFCRKSCRCCSRLLKTGLGTFPLAYRLARPASHFARKTWVRSRTLSYIVGTEVQRWNWLQHHLSQSWALFHKVRRVGRKHPRSHRPSPWIWRSRQSS